jgi:hypothetical protein
MIWVNVKSCKFILCGVQHWKSKCKNKCNVQNVISTWGGRQIHNVFGDGPTKWTIGKKITIKTFVLWDASQLIKLIIWITINT